MNLTDIGVFAIEQLELHGLKGWQFEFDNAKRRLGCCKYRKKTISVSLPLIESGNVSDEMIKNTILHEIAHALVGPSHGHNKVWRRKALEIGCDGDRYAKVNRLFNYISKCPNCNTEYTRLRLSNKVRHACTSCCNKYNQGRFSEKFLLIWHKANPTS